jgi:hypothetical protein
LVIVAHPDDETIWMGGLMIRHPRWDWHILSLCRGDDADRAPRFQKAAREYGALAAISDLDDSPELKPLSPDLCEIKDRIKTHIGEVPDGRPDVCEMRLAVCDRFDLIFTHGVRGEYTRHLRHEQVHRAVCEMWAAGDLKGELIFFAYEDGRGAYTPRPASEARIRLQLTAEEYVRKTHVLKDIYGHGRGSFEAACAGMVEAFDTNASAERVQRVESAFSAHDR